jgi:hypothetical protein
MIDQFEHADKQFEATHDRLRDIAAEIAVNRLNGSAPER